MTKDNRWDRRGKIHEWLRFKRDCNTTVWSCFHDWSCLYEGTSFQIHIFMKKIVERNKKVLHRCTRGRNVQLARRFSDSWTLRSVTLSGIVLHDTLIFRDRGSQWLHALVSQGSLNLNRYDAMIDTISRLTNHRLSNFSIRNEMKSFFQVSRVQRCLL